jgi:hypothetical protein
LPPYRITFTRGRYRKKRPQVWRVLAWTTKKDAYRVADYPGLAEAKQGVVEWWLRWRTHDIATACQSDPLLYRLQAAMREDEGDPLLPLFFRDRLHELGRIDLLRDWIIGPGQSARALWPGRWARVVEEEIGRPPARVAGSPPFATLMEIL